MFIKWVLVGNQLSLLTHEQHVLFPVSTVNECIFVYVFRNPLIILDYL